MAKGYHDIGNGTTITLKHYEDKPLVIKGYKEKYKSEGLYMMEFDVVSKSNPKIKRPFVLWSDWFKNKSDLLAHVRATLAEDMQFKSELANFKVKRE